MDIKLQKRNHASLRKLTKVDQNNNVIEGQEELYVRIDDVPSNLVNQDATPLSEDVFNNINWKDNKALLFTQTDALPDPISGVTQIVSLENGQVWCVPGGGAEAFRLGAEETTLYLLQNFEKFEPIALLGSNTKIGALPNDYSQNGNASASTYLEIDDGSIAFKIDGFLKHQMNTEKVSLTHGNGEICINDTEVALKHNNDKTTIGLVGGSFYIKGNNTQISEDLNASKLNFYTQLNKAIYGNKTIYLEFYPDQVRFLDAQNQKEMVNFKTDGSIYSNGLNRVIDSSIIDNYIKAYLDSNFTNYFDPRFKSKFDESYNQRVTTKNERFVGASTSAPVSLYGDSTLYQIDFSDTIDGEVMTVFFHGVQVEHLNKMYVTSDGSYYSLVQYYAADDSQDDHISIFKYNSLGNSDAQVFIRAVYSY